MHANGSVPLVRRNGLGFRLPSIGGVRRQAEPVPPKAEPVALVGREAAERLAPIRRDGDEPEAWRRGGVGLLGRFDR
jgi:hypothetical protein